MMKNKLTQAISENYEKTLSQIANSARGVGRDPELVKLIVVTKKQPLSVIESTIAAGVKILGENYPEEAVGKMQSLGDESQQIEWHQIGHVQSRKARLVVENFSLLHSLDRLKVARRLDRFAGEMEIKFPVLIEFNISGEHSKQGWDAANESDWEVLRPDMEILLALEHIEIRGLMTMPPFHADAEQVRPYFRKLRTLRNFLASKYPQASWDELSMGTSGDFQVAVEEGATFVRVGRAIVGERLK